MLTNIFLIALAVVLALAAKHIRALRRDVDTLFRLRSEEIERDNVSNLSAHDDVAARHVDRHVTEYHTRK